MLRELIQEQVAHAPVEERRAVGQFGPSHDTCPIDCCLPPAQSSAGAGARGGTLR
jgi:ferrochelatase